MKIKLAKIICWIFLMLGFITTVSAQSDERFSALDDWFDLETNGDIFSGLKSISVLVSLKEAPLLEGVVESQIKTDIETKLRKAGFIIGGEPYLSINVNTIYSGRNIKSFLVEASFVEKFLLARDKNISRSETIWKRKRTIPADNASIKTVKETILVLVNKFIEIIQEAKSRSKRTGIGQNSQSSKQEEIPFTKVYIGGDRPPEVEIFNDSNRTLYLDVGQNKMIAYTILAGTSKKIQLSEGNYNFKATAPRAIRLEGNHNFQKGYLYIWRFTIVKQ